MKKMNFWVKYVIYILSVILAVVLIPISIFLIDGITTDYHNKHPYETNSIEDYGKIVGNNDNKAVEEFVFSFFPKKIEPNFENAEYHYYAKKVGSYEYEAYLEFTIEDKEEFDEYVSSIIDEDKIIPFVYDESFVEFTISNTFYFNYKELRKNNDTVSYWVYDADLGKILYSETLQKVVFVAIGVHNDTIAYIDELDYFINKFNVDIFQMMTTCYPYADYYNAVTGRSTPAVESFAQDIADILNHPNRKNID